MLLGRLLSVATIACLCVLLGTLSEPWERTTTMSGGGFRFCGPHDSKPTMLTSVQTGDDLFHGRPDPFVWIAMAALAVAAATPRRASLVASIVASAALVAALMVGCGSWLMTDLLTHTEGTGWGSFGVAISLFALTGAGVALVQRLPKN